MISRRIGNFPCAISAASCTVTLMDQSGFVPDHMVTTAFELHGYRVTRQLGIVRGITVRSRSVLGTLAGALHTVVGGNITAFTQLCEKARTEAFELMLAHAAQIGANAVLGMRYDANDVMDGVTEVLAYGTAVVVETDTVSGVR